MQALRNNLLEIVAKISSSSSSAIEDETKLSIIGIHGSVKLAALQAAIRRITGKAYQHSANTLTFAELIKAVESTQVKQELKSDSIGQIPTSEDQLKLKSQGFACGIDIEEVNNLPISNDYWEEPFYKDNFTAQEIAYCISQEFPRLHFAARWCAKEALKKCDAKFIELNFSEIETRKLPNGSLKLGINKQFLNGKEWQELPHAVSISHTDNTAAAVVMQPATAS